MDTLNNVIIKLAIREQASLGYRFPLNYLQMRFSKKEITKWFK